MSRAVIKPGAVYGPITGAWVVPCRWRLLKTAPCGWRTRSQLRSSAASHHGSEVR
jgi:hypothetical protein